MLAKYKSNRRFGREIAKGLIKYCFEEIELNELTAYVRVANFGSIKILEGEMQYKEKVYSKKGSFVEKKYKLKKERWLQQQV